MHMLKQPGKILTMFSMAGLVFSVHMCILLGTDWYYSLAWMDILFHFLGGLSIGVGFCNLLSFFESHKAISFTDSMVWRLLVVALVALAATLWEFHEYTLDFLIHTDMQPSITDTMADMFLGLLGGLAATFITHAKKR